jgi:hypothetical protein
MTRVRRMFLSSYLQRRRDLLIMVVVTRLLSPEEAGIFMLPNGLVTMTEAFRDFGVYHAPSDRCRWQPTCGVLLSPPASEYRARGTRPAHNRRIACLR